MRPIRIEPVGPSHGMDEWLQVSNAAAPCRPESAQAVAHARAMSPDSRMVLARRGTVPVGVGWVEHDPWAPDSTFAVTTIAVLPGERRRGVGTTLYEWASHSAADAGLVGLEVWFDVAATSATTFWTRRGFAEVGRERLSHLALGSVTTTPSAPVPPGLLFTTLAARPDLVPGMYLVAQEGITDIPGPQAYTAGALDDWRFRELGSPDLIPEACVIALADGVVVAYCLLVRRGAQPWLAEHEMTAVSRRWRGRGISLAMKQRQIALAADVGLTTLEAMNEERNTAMLRVNEQLGYRPVTAWAQYRGPLHTPSTRMD